MKLFNVVVKTHVLPPSFADKMIYSSRKRWYHGYRPEVDINKRYETSSTKYHPVTGKPYTLFERWEPCDCSDGLCEMARMTKFEVGVSE